MTEDDFLYLNWRHEPAFTEEEVAQIFKDAKMEKMQEGDEADLPADVNPLYDQGEKKSRHSWDLTGSISDCIRRYIQELSEEQLNEILKGLEEGLTEAQVKTYFGLPVEKMSQYRRAYIFGKNEKS